MPGDRGPTAPPAPPGFGRDAAPSLEEQVPVDGRRRDVELGGDRGQVANLDAAGVQLPSEFRQQPRPLRSRRLGSRGRHRSRRPTLLPRPMPTPRATPAWNPTPRRHHNLAAAPPARHHIRAPGCVPAYATVHPGHLPLTVPTTTPEPTHTSCTPVPALCGRNVRTKPEGVSMDVESCPRCGRPVHWSERGRRARWCSQACRRAAYEERRAAATGAIAVRVVQRETTREPSPAECVTRMLGYPRACREVLNGLTTLAGQRATGHRSPHRHPHHAGTTRAHPHRRRHLVTAMPRAAPPMSTVGVGYTHDGHPHPDTYRVQSG